MDATQLYPLRSFGLPAWASKQRETRCGLQNLSTEGAYFFYCVVSFGPLISDEASN